MTVQPDNRERLRAAGLRVTRPRLVVMDVVHDHPHADTDTVHTLARDTLPGVSRQAVYDILDALTGVRLVRRIQPAGHVARYESRVGDNHHHLVCRTCGTVADVDCVVGEAPCLAPSHESGFVLGEAEVTFWGLCPACATPDPIAAP
ncbi:Fur family transcriptional regulator [Rhodococcus sp. NBC_00297]|uniref:Fur family transcriptional regulator n=1 Tax=Rhodococcus sp. NBC_00297 TaxID=2976005 RepID=UPI002E2D5364|nr:Fur family transcriptional regulator [Rhodococcus sp. NBC_00297]